MPIRFRCQHCHQLLGIARRKAGSRVECPTCHARVLVPFTDTAPAPPESAPPSPEPLFERSDFDKVLQAPTGEEPSVLANASQNLPVPGRPGQPQPNGPAFEEASIDVEAVGPLVPPAFSPTPQDPATAPAPVPRPTLTPARASVLVVLAILLLALVFGAGLYVGRYLL